MQKRGFTLGEVLITLAIIGIVVALTVPAIAKNYKATELKTQFKKAYSILNQAIARMNLGEGIVISKLEKNVSFTVIFKKYVKAHKDCGNSGCLYINNHLEEYRTYAKNLNITPEVYRWDDGQLVLENGMLIMIENPYSTGLTTTMISVDINGMEKGPNAWGHDVFTFQVMDNGKLMPMGASDTALLDTDTFCSKTSTSKINGVSCAYYALTDEDYFKNLP